MKLERIETSDGSFTYRDQTLDVTYKSIHGAESESVHVFLEGTNLIQNDANRWRVLELGFGTGMNFSTTYAFAQKNKIKLEYSSLEPFLIPIEDLLIDSEIKLRLEKKKGQSESNYIVESKDLRLEILEMKWQDCSILKTFDAYYHDPFGPTTSPDCWSRECFEWAFARLSDQGKLATYGASTAGRKAMAAAGFFVAKRKGFGKKREMTIAAKQPSQLLGDKILKPQAK